MDNAAPSSNQVSPHRRRPRQKQSKPAPSHFKTEEDEKLIKLALHKSPFFTCLDEEQIERLVAAAERKVYDPGEIVILEGCVDEDDDDELDLDDDDDYYYDSQGIPRRRSAISVDRRDSQVAVYEGPADDYEMYDDDVEGNATPAASAAADSNRGESNSSTADQRRRHTIESPPEIGGGGSDHDEDEDEEEGIAENDPQESSPASSFPTSLLDDKLRRQATALGEDDDEQAQPSTSPPPPPPPPPRSGIKRSVYIVKNGHADIWYHPGFNPASLGPGTLFGDGGFLFGRQHAASVIANKLEKLECWVVDFKTFRNHVLPSANMSQLFEKYASQKSLDGTRYMTMNDFVKAIEQEESAESVPSSMRDPLVSLRIANTYNILSKRKHQHHNNNGRIYLSDFCIFHLLMARPDPEVDIAFLLMDQKQTGQIRLDDVKKFVYPIFPGLDVTSQFFTRYFGVNGDFSIREHDFSQFLIDLQCEMGKQAFLAAVEEKGIDGYLTPTEFVNVLKTACFLRLPEGVADRLESMYCHGPIEAGEAAALVSLRAGTLKRATVKEITQATEKSVLADMEQREKRLGLRYFAYGDFIAFQEVLANLPGICNTIDRAQEVKQGPISPDDLKVANRVLGLGGGRLSRRQVDIIFSLFDLDRDGFVSHEDTVSVCGVDFAQRLVAVRGRANALTFAPPPKYRHEHARGEKGDESVDDSNVTAQIGHFGLSTFAGTLGVIALYPLEFVKTRLMNQRILIAKDGSVVSGRLYANSIDCLAQAFRTEGFAGLYRGIVPQLLGAAPEKAIKLEVYSLLKQVFINNQDGDQGASNKISVPFEILAGACAGACQVLVTNPMEIVKTRLILQGETSGLMRKNGLTPSPPQTFTGVVKDLGFLGVYRGAAATMLRDVPFSAIYFPTYAALKGYLANSHDEAGGMPRKTSLTDLLLAGTLAGVPAAFCTTPLDVIRVRLQAIPRPGESSYSGIRDCAERIHETEGLQGFFRGSTARVLRIAPQFGITLLAYEQLTQKLGFAAASSPPTNAPVDPNDYRTAFPARSIRPKTDDIDSWMRNFGVLEPSSSSPPPPPSPSSQQSNPNSRR